MHMQAVANNELVIVKDGATFVYTMAMVKQHLLEGWAPDESTLCEVDNVQVELYPHHYKRMLELMSEYTPCTCKEDEDTRFVQDHGCCQWCYFVGE